MADLFTLTQPIIDIAQSAINSLINSLGKNCRLIYPPTPTTCSCTLNPLSQSVFGPTGGPVPASIAVDCHMCGGTGFRLERATEDIKMLCTLDPKEFVKFAGNTKLANADLQTKTYIRFWPKIKMCQEMIVQTPLMPYSNMVFKLASDVLDVGNICQGMYCVAFWSRVA